MQGIILAGGTGSRLRPLTDATNKHLLPVHDRPMIHYPIRTLVDAGVTDLVIVTGAQWIEAFRAALADGRSLGMTSLRFAAQPAPAGIADALLRAEPIAGGGRLAVALGDNIFGGSVRAARERFERQRSGARLLLARSEHPRSCCVARLKEGRIADLVEKPAEAPPDASVVAGLYFYDEAAFDLARSLRPGARGELEITDLNLAYLRRGDLECEPVEGWWMDAGTHESLAAAAARLRGGG
jgi:glucose-1-phosphate thymidylyltransferase